MMIVLQGGREECCCIYCKGKGRKWLKGVHSLMGKGYVFFKNIKPCKWIFRKAVLSVTSAVNYLIVSFMYTLAPDHFLVDFCLYSFHYKPSKQIFLFIFVNQSLEGNVSLIMWSIHLQNIYHKQSTKSCCKSIISPFEIDFPFLVYPR